MDENVLKPLSPNKTPGRLSLLQNDNIDENFKVVFNHLYNIELSTKQSQVDLSQLIDRSKNNNENLNKLLESLVNSNINARDIVEPIVDELKELHLDTKSTNLLTDILTRLNEENDKQHDKQVNPDNNHEIRELLISIRDKQSEINDKQTTILKTHELENKYNVLSDKYDALNDKYNQLSNLYEAKYQSLIDLKSQYNELLAESKQEISVDYNKLSNIQQLHDIKLKSIPKRTIDHKKRIVSTNI